ncbi:beta-phosphoglucomutase [Streptococcus moroccensis]|uniref:Beta-phosphoglucomutase n=1 Tax=Streptococcus moroccensis TaxID=1451356 RepID=A0ABT9YUA6_9STRE|nr:beta-phosphoglucomutase [Streptococcus moroccensis]MDQ0223576.1 beta-phosphoglucomutase [Streptococcus moroccensis]
MYQAVIFDLDGVICHTDSYHYKAWKFIADKIGATFNETINGKLRGVGRLDSLDIILKESGICHLSPNEKAFLAEAKNDYYLHLLDYMAPQDLDESVLRTLRDLKNIGIKIAIGSSSKNAKRILEKLEIINMFDAISDGTNISHAKPNPEVFTKAAEMLGVLPSCSLVVEDAISGVEAASRGGFDSAGLGDAKSHPNVTFQLSNFEDLIGIVR